MKKLLFLTFALLVCVVAYPQSKINSAGRIILANDTTTGADAKKYAVSVIFNNDKDDFGNCDVEVLSRFGNTATVSVTARQAEQIAELPQVKSVAFAEEVVLPEPDGNNAIKAGPVETEKKESTGGFFGWLKRLFKKG